MGEESYANSGCDELLTEEEISLVLDYLLSHKKKFIQEFLRKRGLHFSGTKEKLRERLECYLDDGRICGTELVELLNGIEGWGNQHIYLYKAPAKYIEPWLEENSAKKSLGDVGWEELFNRPRPVVLPEEPTLSSIEWTPEKVRFIWVEKRCWEERIPEKDIKGDNIVWRAYRVNVSRGVISFELDLMSGDAMLMIRRLPQGTKYHQVRDRFENELTPILDFSYFERVRVSQTIRRIQESDEVRRRQLFYQTKYGGKIEMTSSSQLEDTFEDPILRRTGEDLQKQSAGLLGNFYWLPVKDKLETEVHCKIYARDQRVGIFGEHREEDVRYVLSRIRYYCK